METMESLTSLAMHQVPIRYLHKNLGTELALLNVGEMQVPWILILVLELSLTSEGVDQLRA